MNNRNLVGKILKISFDETGERKYLKLKSSCGPDTEHNIFVFSDLMYSISSQQEARNLSPFCYFKDHWGDIIEADLILDVIYQFINAPNFILRYCTVKSEKKNVDLPPKVVHESVFQEVSNEEYSEIVNLSTCFKEFLKLNEGAGIFINLRENNGLTISELHKKLLIKLAGQFLCSKFEGNNPPISFRIKFAYAIVLTIPCFKAKTKFGGAEIFFHPIHKSGYLAQQIKYRNRAKRKYDCKELDITAESPSKLSKERNDNNNFEEDLKFMQAYTLPAQKADLMKVLERTIHLRKDYVARSGQNIKLDECFPFYFIDPELILFDFELIYKGKQASYFSNWSGLKDHSTALCIEKGFKNDVVLTDDWNNNIRNFVILLKLLPSPPGRNIANRSKFPEIIDKLIIFEKITTGLQDPIPNLQKQPFMIATGKSKKSISQYFIQMDGIKISMPTNYSFDQVFNIFFCLFFIFDIEYENDLKSFFQFFQILYEIENSKTVVRAREIYNLLKLRSHTEC